VSIFRRGIEFAAGANKAVQAKHKTRKNLDGIAIASARYRTLLAAGVVCAASNLLDRSAEELEKATLERRANAHES
jgi:hypothetical protein